MNRAGALLGLSTGAEEASERSRSERGGRIRFVSLHSTAYLKVRFCSKT